MHIKQVIIEGFRSYKDQTIIDPFSHMHNVIVGRNGSGKSNFFFAIQFVLSDEFTNMSGEERQQLLHEGSGARVVSAFVEIVFDNSDNRLPIDKEEVGLRRVIGAKKDSYYLDKKHVLKSEVMNLLETAGFSRSNPYYIVKQGRINQIAMAPDTQRLQLLREVAGTRVYDDKKVESESILKETESSREKITEHLENIEDRLTTLEEETQELKEYQKWDKCRRAAEYALYEKELREANNRLFDNEKDKDEFQSFTKHRHQESKEAMDNVDSLERKVREIKQRMRNAVSENQQIQEERAEQVKLRAQLQLDKVDMEQSVCEDENARDSLKRELGELTEEIRTKDGELQSVLPQYNEIREHEQGLNSEISRNEMRQQELYAKQGRGKQFRTKQERDKWLKKEAGAIKKTLASQTEQRDRLQGEVEQLRATISDANCDVTGRQTDLEVKRERIEQLSREHTHLRRERDELNNKRKEYWREESGLDQQIHTIREELSKAERAYRSTMSKTTNLGLDALNKIVEERDIRGVYGPLIDNFECVSSDFYTAVEVTAGNRLFHVIVETDDIASDILRLMNKRKLPGEITFLPLNRLLDERLPSSLMNSDDNYPLMEKLEYSSQVYRAIKTVFGKVFLCRDLDVAANIARIHDMDCVTLEGDQVSRKGALTGGYMDRNRSRLQLKRSVWDLTRKLRQEEGYVCDVRKKIERVDQEVSSVLSQVQNAETELVQFKEAYERQKMEMRNLTREQQANSKTLLTKESTLVSLNSEISQSEQRLRTTEGEVGTEMLSQLAEWEQNELESLSEEIARLKTDSRKTLKERIRLEQHKLALDNLLVDNLLRRKQEKDQELEDLTMVNKSTELESLQADYTIIETRLAETDARMGEVGGQQQELLEQQKEFENDLEEWKAKEKELNELITEDSKQMDKLANKKSLLLKKKEEAQRKMREIGSLPEGHQQYQGLKTKELWNRVQKCNSELKKYSHVNKKALEQFVQFSELKEKLLKRRAEVDVSYSAIEDMIKVLEFRKYEAILNTFKQVSRFFTEVFQELVPNGTAKLRMRHAVEPPSMAQSGDTPMDSTGLSSQASEATGPANTVIEKLVGVSIEVSFSGIANETREIQQLSGGQKSLVALTLIFAIQKCDPAPFYLFDEIDQALDPHHRKAVANMIRRLSQHAQFITTTFRPELLDAADKFYGVTFRNKVSHVKAVSKEMATDFVEEDVQVPQENN